MNRLIVALVFVLLGSNAFAQESKAEEVYITVHVYALTPLSTGGFVDKNSQKALKARQDSVNDIKRAFQGKHDIRLVDNIEDAKIKLQITNRSAFSFLSPNQEPIRIYALLVVDNYTLNIMGQPLDFVGPGWRGAAGDIVHQVEEWAKMNKDRLKSRAAY